MSSISLSTNPNPNPKPGFGFFKLENPGLEERPRVWKPYSAYYCCHRQCIRCCRWTTYIADPYMMHIIGCLVTHFLIEVAVDCHGGSLCICKQTCDSTLYSWVKSIIYHPQVSDFLHCLNFVRHFIDEHGKSLICDIRCLTERAEHIVISTPYTTVF